HKTMVVLDGILAADALVAMGGDFVSLGVQLVLEDVGHGDKQHVIVALQHLGGCAAAARAAAEQAHLQGVAVDLLGKPFLAAEDSKPRGSGNLSEVPARQPLTNISV